MCSNNWRGFLGRYIKHIHYGCVRRSCQPLCSGPWFNIKISSYQYRKSHCGDKTVVRSSYLHNGISYTGKMASLYLFSPQDMWKHIQNHTFFQNVNVLTNIVPYNCDIFLWNWSNAMNIYSALWVLMARCFSTKASVTIVLSTHPLWVNSAVSAVPEYVCKILMH